MLALIIAVGLVLRLTPWLRDPAIAAFDVAFENERFRVLALAGTDTGGAAGALGNAIESHDGMTVPAASRRVHPSSRRSLP